MTCSGIGDIIFAGNWSVRRTILAILLLTISVWSMGTFILYLEAGRESQKLLDQSLEETAQLLLVLADHKTRNLAAAPLYDLPKEYDAAEGRDLLFQIWHANGKLLYRNKGAPDAPFSAADVTGFSYATIAGVTWRTYSAWNAGYDIQIQVGEPSIRRNDVNSRFFYKFLLLALAVLPVMATGIFWIVSRGLRPLLIFAEEVSQRSPNDLRWINTNGAPLELQPLLQAINHLFVRVSDTFEREQRFTAGAAHELRTPLAAIKTNLQVLQGARTEAERNEFIAALGVSVDRSSRLVTQLLTLSRLDLRPRSNAGLRPVDLAELLTAQLPALRCEAARLQLQFEAHISSVRCLLDPDDFKLLFCNLIDNSFRYTPKLGTVQISCRVDGSDAYISVSDTGPGIPVAMRERVFERFLRLSDAGSSGSGLGLTIVRKIAFAHGAAVVLKDGLNGRGLLVEIRFSLAPNIPCVTA